MRAFFDFALSQAPRLYARILRWRREVDVEKLVYLAIVQRGDVVFDVGANAGYYTLLFSHLVGSGGRVHAFEPVPRTFAALTSHLADGKRFDNVILNDCALSVGGDDTLQLFVPDSDYGQASIARHSAGSWLRPEEVSSYICRAATIDAYVGGRAEMAPSFIKCDVEGAELLVLQGGAETIRRHLPILHLEVNPEWTRSLGYEPSDLVRFLSSLGYTCFHLVETAVRHLVDPVGEVASLHSSANLLCAVPGLHDARLRRLSLAPAKPGGD